ncbi:MAG: mannose-6-phosphate isomerase, class I [Candidatus Methylacidiphilales bacterium]
MPLWTLQPIYQERIWGGRALETKLGRSLPTSAAYGESWELCDRPEAQSVFRETGHALHDAWVGPNKATIFGTAAPASERFPILIKILDAADKLSLQVHPPASLAPKFGGEPKTECWFFMDAEKDAEIYVGLKQGVTRERFRQAISEKTVSECVHRLKTARGDFMFLPSGRVHAIGAGNLILEVQQNSDTTFRVYDWDRIDAKTGKPRELHVEESLESINFHDFEPVMAQPHGQCLLRCDFFHLYRHFLFDREHLDLNPDRRTFQFIAVTAGSISVSGREFRKGDTFFVTADSDPFEIVGGTEEAEIVITTFPVD